MSDEPVKFADGSLLGYWRFDEESGDTALDSSGNGNNGQLVNARRGGAGFEGTLDLKGADDSHVSVPGTPRLRAFDDKITVSALAYARSYRIDGNGAATYIVLFSRQIGDALHPDQFYLGFGPDQQDHRTNRYKWHLGSTDGEGDAYFGDPVTNRWIHMVGTYDGATMRLYVDGAEIGSVPLTGKIRVDDNPLTIGAEENFAAPQIVDNEFDGYIDNVRIFNRALSADEVRALYDVDKK